MDHHKLKQDPQVDLYADVDDPHLVFGVLLRISTRLETVGNSFLDGLTTKQWFFLAILSFHFSEPPTMGEMAMRMGSSHQNVKQIAIKLEKKGYLRLDRDTRDRRILRILTTPKVAQYEKAHRERNEEFLRLLFQPLSKEEIYALRTGLFQLDHSLTCFQAQGHFPDGTPNDDLQ